MTSRPATALLGAGRPRDERGSGRQRVLEQAAWLFLQHGYRETTLRDIAAAAGMKAGSIYYHFDSKEQLLAAVLDTGIERITRSFTETAATTDDRTPAQGDATLSRPPLPPPLPDRNTLLLSLADRLREEIRRASQQTLGLTYDSDRDAATLMRRWATLGFRVPREFVRPVPALVERAAEGFPADIHTLFYAWTLLVDLPDGQALALQAPDLPALLYDNASGRTRTAMPDLRMTAALERSLPTESRS